ncbi:MULTISPECIES: DNA-3-methyladenine glycosylase [unclassified Cryobacterium]|uniref:DNA-3-methyladenine glycosylase n=1 Tax=unclassified Cryobacterium TaxID=2649013 RepID=UPI00106DA0DA|nr:MULTISPECIES: DNA-3-methyladenine glycosylase [unclassified Cryobacterium]TFD08989.1 DNA-3-methyladenine glycosylase [Cryobacterium sp. TMT1-2-2]TFD10811.1 DNA-3-methyladenine glycosylase [Cryobacterium sp. TMT1-66-1]
MTFAPGLLERPALEVAPLLLGALVTRGAVSVRITEVEAYLGESDPGSHAFRGRTPRTQTMFGPPGHLYAYFSYGMYVCANVVCSPDGEASAVLLRGGEVVAGIDEARSRRLTSKTDADLARGPARLTKALGIVLGDDGADLTVAPFDLEVPARRADFATGPRTGVSGLGGEVEYPWRFWVPGEASVSPYRRSTRQARR